MRRAARAALALCLALAAGCAAESARSGRVGALVPLPAPGGAGFVGSEACAGCHAAAFASWSASAHGGEYAGLPAADRVRAACLRCHVTGYAERAFAGGGARGLAAVGCEACHGPGADHATSAHPGLVPTATGGACPPCEVNRVCRLCHTPERSPGFDLARDLARVRCPGDAGR